LGPGQSAFLQSDGNGKYHSIADPPRAKFGFLSHPILYVCLTGNDRNHGLTPSSPLQTLQGIMDYLFTRWDHGGSSLTLQACPGKYAGFSARGGLDGHYGNPSITFPPTLTLRGDPNNQEEYIIDGGAGDAVQTVLGKSIHLDG